MSPSGSSITTVLTLQGICPEPLGFPPVLGGLLKIITIFLYCSHVCLFTYSVFFFFFVWQFLYTFSTLSSSLPPFWSDHVVCVPIEPAFGWLPSVQCPGAARHTWDPSPFPPRPLRRVRVSGAGFPLCVGITPPRHARDLCVSVPALTLCFPSCADTW